MRELDLALQAIDAGAAITIIPVCYGIPDLGALRGTDGADGLETSATLQEWQVAWQHMASRSTKGSTVDIQRWECNLRRLDRHHQAMRFTHSEATKGRENDLLRRVALSVFQRLPPLLHVAAEGDFVVDMADGVAQVRELMNTPGTAVVGIVGPGKSHLQLCYFYAC